MPHDCNHTINQKAKDPVCGMQVDIAHASVKADHGGQTWYFCCQGCREKFLSEPEKYLSNVPRPVTSLHQHSAQTQASAARVTASASMYTCPMHPEVNQDHPGSCPKCGMALEPVMPVVDATRQQWTCPMHPEVIQDKPGACPKCGMALEPMQISQKPPQDPELRKMTLRLWIGALLTLPLMVIAMRGWLLHPWLGKLSSVTWNWSEFVLSAPVVLWAGWPFFQRAWQSLINRSLNMYTLISLGVSVSFVYSLLVLMFPGLIPASFRGADGSLPVYFEAAAAITTLVLLGEVLQMHAMHSTSAAIRGLMELAPPTAHRIAGGVEQDVPLSRVQVGDSLRVRAGEHVPVDGAIIQGSSHVDESMLTGEPLPVAKNTNAAVRAGTLNGDGSFVMRAERVGADTLLARIVAQVATAQRSRAPIQSLADRVSAWFVPIVVGVAVLTFWFWYLAGPAPQFAHALVNAVAVLIIACPCALGLATPVSITVAMGRGAQSGVLFRDAAALERLRDVDTLLVDKTGTLTEGKPKVVALETTGNSTNESELLRLAATLETGSLHPLAAAITSAARERGIAAGYVSQFNSITGQGITGMVEGRPVAIGNEKMLQEFKADTGTLAGKVQSRRAQGAMIAYVLVDRRLAGFIAIADPIRDSALHILRQLRQAGLNIHMLTGDHETTARYVAGQLGIESYQAGVSPEGKLEAVKKLQAAGAKVAMTGDGINDAPALASADVGIAMGTGADIAMQTAAVTLVSGGLTGLVRARRLSQATVRNIRQNLFWAFAYNSLGIPLAAGVLYPFFGLLLSPMIAAAAMSFSSVSVVANALRLRLARL
ncbi:MAG: heavy metal translocating P-type ATPase [Gammaproteobacteria bacterium]|nr:heavy metal translocating P-type ATPase [Gammaproteobacteria bacterium]MDE2345800.1 heavy metal translocating P-type ATPase [Gammaproteobacteria bacterium]